MKSTKVASTSSENEPSETNVPRMPVQQRSQQRVEAALAVAERMVEAWGPERISIPEIAKAADVPRASLYQFFPDKYALLARITEMHLTRLTEALAERALKQSTESSYSDWIGALIDATANYYDTHPAARILVLGGPYSHAAYLAQANMMATIGGVLRSATELKIPGVRVPQSPDVATLAVEIAFACMKHGYHQEGGITPAIRAQAVTAVVAYAEASIPGLAKAFKAGKKQGANA
ncbi:TetR/AcrR family transcriptional regulator [Pararobbsia silviterrae]|uniref:TetR/AcrR family transcriptional regulator n=1 Tax=Pararobbsia silviterrae TaxID=1792498 RepID=A0A494XGD1_9BURK|nr:TetR/AcrR family transcriptional regulator [Pararobbsia silviterrae]RKP47144.1 TetR/AcrR family transcriptional regulator [Pararobbsia silviterrae]